MITTQKPVVIVGGGFTGVYTAKELLKKQVPVLLVNDTNYFTFTPLLHEVATGSLIDKDIIFEFESFFKDPNFHFIRGRVEEIDSEKKSIRIGSDEIAFSYAVLASGSTTNTYNIPGAKHAFELKSIGDATKFKKAVIERVQGADPNIHITVIGGGPTGVELLFDTRLMLEAIKAQNNQMNYELCLINSGNELVSMFDKRIRDYVKAFCKQSGVTIHLETRATKIGPDEVETTNGSIKTNIAVLAAGVKPASEYVNEDILEKNHILVDKHLRLKNETHIFAGGDVISIDGDPTPKLAQLAVGQAKCIAKNILASESKSELNSYKPVLKGKLLSLGYGKGIGEIGPIVVKGIIAWYLWRTAYLFKVPGLWNKLRVAFTWTLNLFQGRNLTER